MRPISLLLVFVLAKLFVLIGHTVALSFWTPIAYFWQDMLVVLGFAVIDSRWLYWVLSIYAAVNIPVGRVVSTPLTWSMLRAARGPLADSILLYVTWTNVLLVFLTLAAAVVLPYVFRRVPRRAIVLALPIVLLGSMASARVDTLGLDRNVLVALIPRVHANPAQGDWRLSRYDSGRVEDLTAYREIARGRNVILVSLESHAAQYLSLYGGPYDLTPNLTALARNGLVFENAYAVYPESIKGLFSILCSTFPTFGSQSEAYAKIPCHSVAEVLSASGYRTGLFHSGRFAYLGMESIIRNRGYQTLEDAGDIGGNHQSSFGIDEPSTVTRILAWIDALPHGQRFFVTYLPIAGHHPYEAPEGGPYPEREEIDRYRNALHYGDAALGKLVDGLRGRGLDQNTLWIVVGDHGEAFGQHEGNYGHTFFLYDENIRVPFLIAAPGAIPAQVRARTVVSLVDTAPTILDLLGISAPTNYQGRSALDGNSRMALFFTDYSLGLLGLRDGRWKFIYELESGRSRLFDLNSDPDETTDLSPQNSERASWYKQVVRGWTGR